MENLVEMQNDEKQLAKFKRFIKLRGESLFTKVTSNKPFSESELEDFVIEQVGRKNFDKADLKYTIKLGDQFGIPTNWSMIEMAMLEYGNDGNDQSMEQIYNKAISQVKFLDEIRQYFGVYIQ